MSTSVERLPETAPAPTLRGLRGVVMRGGTSKGVFLHDGDLPAEGPQRDAVVLDLMGSPDSTQIDGLGGTHATTSKVAVVGRSPDPDVDIDYAVAQVHYDKPVVDWSGTCGNLTSAVGPFAIDEGLVHATEPVTTLRLRNRSTSGLIVATVPVAGGVVVVDGDFRIAGVPSPGAPVTTTYLDPAGSMFSGALPTGSLSDTVTVGARTLEVSIVDVSHPYVFVVAADVGLRGDESPGALNGNAQVLAELGRIREASADLLSRGSGVGADTPSSGVPRLVLVADPINDDEDLRTLSLAMGEILPALPVTAALCLAAAAALSAAAVRRVAGQSSGRSILRIAHPSGVAEAQADVGPDATVRSASVTRTARRLMSGTIHLREPFAAEAATAQVPMR